ncbi:MAG: hypothetical protein C4548_06245 [Desulfobacteraceae bacterium]|jgi:hypothetical protein|nr:MAG: hypothetical protein C4548_06245 [Desulfobacteraceae bacterium]
MLNYNNFFYQNILVHTHIAKAAGSSFLFGLTKIVGEEYVYDGRHAEKKLSDLSNQEIKKLRLISGHFHLSKKISIPVEDKFFSHFLINRILLKPKHVYKKKLYMCTLRDPISRFISFYNFVIERPSHPAFGSVVGKSLDEVVSDYIKKEHPKIKNSQCMAVSGKKAPSFKDVLDALSRYYILITPYFQVNEALNAMSRVMGADKEFNDVKINVGKTKDDYISDKNRKHLMKLTALDQKLYHYSVEHFPRFIRKLEKALSR